MSEQPEAINEAPEVAAEGVEKEPLPYDSAERCRRIYGKRNPDSVIEARRQRLFVRMQDGHTPRRLVLEHSEREGIAVKTAWADWKGVQEWVTQDFERERPVLVSRIHAMRERLFNAALRKGQLQTAAMLLKDMGAVVGEAAQEAQAAAAPTLNITVDDKRSRE